jgi:4a-hydroxytetrahydrobiopterin dehydratase
MQKLGDKELKDAVEKLPGWRLEGGKVLRDFQFTDFGHHPDIDIRYNKVQLGLVTHDAGGITAKDVEMAAKLSENV